MTRTVTIGAAVLLGGAASTWWMAGCGSVSCSDNLNCGQGADGGPSTGDGGSDVLSTTDSQHGDAPTSDGSSGCHAPTTLNCNGTCVDPTQPAHCGTCTNACGSADAGTGQATCTAGTCGVGCTAPTSLNCSGGCFDPSSPAHCGNSCTAFTVCPSPTAGSGTPTCTLEPDGGGSCGLQCVSPTIDCSGACVDPTQPTHCGSACTVCPGPTTGAATGTPTCTVGADGGGACSVTCSGSTTEECPVSAGGTACYALTDVNHCNGCNTVCPGPVSGANGQAACSGATPACSVTCNTGYHPCGTPTDCLSNTDEPLNAATDPCILTEAFGVFVKPTGSDTTGTGSRTAPYATIGHAMDQAKTAGLPTPRVYACGSAGNYTENLVVGTSRTGVTVYGALDCTTSPSTWTYNAADKATVAPATGYALQVTAAVTIEDFAFTSASATAAGGSSIAVFANGASGVVLQRCNVTAGAGLGGQSANPVAQASAAPPGSPGNPPTSGPPKEGGTGGPGGSNPSCSSVGGTGGSASAVSGTPNGGDGSPGGSNGELSATCATTGNPPTLVATGGPGSEGLAATDWASFGSTGWSPLGGQAGTSGGVGQGGGGGGAGAVIVTIGGGGGGGAGGCGGSGGAPGAGGGSSIAILAYNSTITITTCTLTAAAAGPGGHGAAGQPGQPGGAGGAAGTGSCGGGAGGSGGNGGGGGGGAGGVSAGVVWTGTAPTITGGSQTPGAAGAAGANGDATVTAKAGTAGGVVQFQ